jgi:hypothetical protein
MNDLALIAILVAAFVLAIGLVQGVDQLINRRVALGDLADEPPDTRPDAGAVTVAADPGRPG